MKSILTVVTPASTQDLTTLANVKAEIGITGTAEDTNINLWIDQASSVIAGECNRVFGQETVLESCGVGAPIGMQWPEYERIVLTRNPVASITTLVEDGNTLVSGTDYEVDKDSGIITRLIGDFERRWWFRTLAVTYVAGYQLLGTLPEAIERACISLVKQFRYAAQRDPLLKSEDIPGVLSQTFWVGGVGEKSNGLPLDVETLIAPYRNPAI
jgi:hypothetical protein